MTETEILKAPRFDNDQTLYWRRKCGELMATVAELEVEIGTLNAVLTQSGNSRERIGRSSGDNKEKAEADFKALMASCCDRTTMQYEVYPLIKAL